MTDEKKIFSITACPRCGGRYAEVKQYIRGSGTYQVDLETGEADATELHSGLNYTNARKYAVCSVCGRRLFDIAKAYEEGFIKWE